ncbi:hypothetical protein GCM10017673_22700 [Streptosporangium violaceochromogenes]|nr:hypothetical protein GCM10017673_22700 [Streptosporangium violaceochromogenes]
MRISCYGYRLRVGFETSTGATWPLNIGQVHTALSRLERDGLVAPGEQDAQGRVASTVTEAEQRRPDHREVVLTASPPYPGDAITSFDVRAAFAGWKVSR